jgi:hypothetical protein
MKKLKLSLVIAILATTALQAQNEAAQTIDPSKPTNLYTQFNALAEFSSNEDFNLIGTRLNFQYAINADNLVLAEFPILYNDGTKHFGLSDVRLRYFNAVKRNINKTIIAIVPFADLTVPTGSFENGLGGDTWSISAGTVVGLLLSEKISLFPGANYVYLTKSQESGVGFQTNLSYRFTPQTFVFVNPIVTLFSFDTIWQAELNLNHIIVPNKLKVNVGWYPNFTNNIDDFRAGGTIFF